MKIKRQVSMSPEAIEKHVIEFLTIGKLPLVTVRWNGGRFPTKQDRSFVFKKLRKHLFREQILECGGLDLWVCAGTSVLERARIFWNRADADALATLGKN